MIFEKKKDPGTIDFNYARINLSIVLFESYIEYLTPNWIQFILNFVLFFCNSFMAYVIKNSLSFRSFLKTIIIKFQSPSHTSKH